jgi:hypothetical protein
MVSTTCSTACPPRVATSDAADDTAFRALRGLGATLTERRWKTVAFASMAGAFFGAFLVLVPVLAWSAR